MRLCPFSASVALATACGIFTAPSTARAEEIQLDGPLAGACIARLDHYCVPAVLEWTSWVSAGATDLRQGLQGRIEPFVGVGAEVTRGVLTYGGFPAPYPRYAPGHGSRRLDHAEVRLGPWAAGETRATGAALEGGLTAHVGSTNDYRYASAQWTPLGNIDLRLGAGYGAFLSGRSPYLVVGLGLGYRVVFDRHTWGGACDPMPRADALDDATLVRIVATLRRPTDFPASELLIGIEVSPTSVLVWSRAQRRRYRPDS